jgi:hypothetical protein
VNKEKTKNDFFVFFLIKKNDFFVEDLEFEVVHSCECE